MGNPHAGFDEAGAGNVAMGAGLRPAVKTADSPPDPNVGAPALDPTTSADRRSDFVGSELGARCDRHGRSFSFYLFGDALPCLNSSSRSERRSLFL